MNTVFNGKNKRFAALFFAVLIIMVTFFSSAFEIKELNHDCVGNDCTVCSIISQCEENIRQIGSGSLTLTAVIVVICFFSAAILFSNNDLENLTLITEKVRLNN